MIGGLDKALEKAMGPFQEMNDQSCLRNPFVWYSVFTIIFHDDLMICLQKMNDIL